MRVSSIISILFCICALYSQGAIIDTLHCVDELNGVISFNYTQQYIIAYQGEHYCYIGDLYDFWLSEMCANYGYFSYEAPEPVIGYHLNSAVLFYYVDYMVGNGTLNIYPQFDMPWGVVEPPLLIDHIDYGTSISWQDISPVILNPPRVLIDSLATDLQSSNVSDWVQEDIENERAYIQCRIWLMNDSDWDGSDDHIVIHNFLASRKSYIVVEFSPDSTSIDDTIIPTIKNVSNAPNPFTESTSISFELSKTELIQLSIYNVKGQLIKTLINSIQAKGNHNIVWNGTDGENTSVSSGIYFYRLVTPNKVLTSKIIMLK